MARKFKTNINHVIQKRLAEILIRDSKDPRFARVTISRVESTSDKSFARVYFSLFPPEDVEEVSDSLNRAAGFFSNQLGKFLQTRNTPRLNFIFDEGFDFSLKLDRLIKEVRPSAQEDESESDSESE